MTAARTCAYTGGHSEDPRVVTVLHICAHTPSCRAGGEDGFAWPVCAGHLGKHIAWGLESLVLTCDKECCDQNADELLQARWAREMEVA
jgi:hypothetical protein